MLDFRSANQHMKGNGSNYPDIKLLLSDSYNRNIPVMIEAKGPKGKLEMLDDGFIRQVVTKKDKRDYSAVKNYAVNGALHYGLACLNSDDISEVIIIGINGSELNEEGRGGNLKFFRENAF